MHLWIQLYLVVEPLWKENLFNTNILCYCQNACSPKSFTVFFLLTGNITDVLQEAEVHYISRKICGSEQSYGKFIPNTSFCAGAEDGIFDTCRVRTNDFPLKYFLKLERNFDKAFEHFLVRS